MYRVFPKNIDDLKVLDKLLKAGHDGVSIQCVEGRGRGRGR